MSGGYVNRFYSAVAGVDGLLVAPAGPWDDPVTAGQDGSATIILVIISLFLLSIIAANVTSKMRARRAHRAAVARLLGEVEEIRRDPLLVFQIRRRAGWPTQTKRRPNMDHT